MRDDSADTLAGFVVMAIVYILFGIVTLAFKYPKVMIPFLVIGGALLVTMASQ
jgi:hypothetical protein